MEWIYITFRSITYAQKGQRLLEREGIRGTLMRAPRWMEPRGCAYALRLAPDLKKDPGKLLTAGGVPWQKVYASEGRGKVREL